MVQVYDEESLSEMHRKLLLNTYMIDSAIETYPENQAPKELIQKRNKILEDREKLKAKCDPVVEILERKEVKELMENARDREGNSKVLEYIEQKHGVCAYFYFCMVGVIWFGLDWKKLPNFWKS